MRKSLPVLALSIGLSCLPEVVSAKDASALQVENGAIILHLEGEQTKLSPLPTCNGLTIALKYQRIVIEGFVGGMCQENVRWGKKLTMCVDKNATGVTEKKLRRVFPNESPQEMGVRINDHINGLMQNVEVKDDVCMGAEFFKALVLEYAL